MQKIDKVSWGKVKVNGRLYHQALIIGEQIFEREDERLHQLFGTTPEIGEWEEEKLLSGKPEIILIANGWDGLLKVNSKLKTQIQKLGIELRIVLTPEVIDEYNQLVKQKKRVNALIHTTC